MFPLRALLCIGSEGWDSDEGQVRILSYDKTADELRLDLYVAAGTASAGLALGRPGLRYNGMFAHYDFDDFQWMNGNLLNYPSLANNPALILGDGTEMLAPLKLPSSAPLFGGYQVGVCLCAVYILKENFYWNDF